jgi:hypothetical protein
MAIDKHLLIELFKQSTCWEFRVKGTEIVDEVEGVNEAEGKVIGKNTGAHDVELCEIIGGQEIEEIAQKLIVRAAAKRPTVQAQIQFVRNDRTSMENLLDLAGHDMKAEQKQEYINEIEMLRSIEENLIAVKLWNDAKAKEVNNG